MALPPAGNQLEFTVTQSNLATGEVGAQNNKGFAAIGQRGRLNIAVDALLSSIFQQPTGAVAGTYTNVPIGGFTSSTPALFTVVVNGSSTITSITVEGTGGQGYMTGLTLWIDAGQLGGSTGPAKMLLTPNDLKHGIGGAIHFFVDYYVGGSGATYRIEAQAVPPNYSTATTVISGIGDPAIETAYDYESGDTIHITSAYLTQSGMWDASTYDNFGDDIFITINGGAGNKS